MFFTDCPQLKAVSQKIKSYFTRLLIPGIMLVFLLSEITIGSPSGEFSTKSCEEILLLCGEATFF